jgi:hypothetical protein
MARRDIERVVGVVTATLVNLKIDFGAMRTHEDIKCGVIERDGHEAKKPAQ